MLKTITCYFPWFYAIYVFLLLILPEVLHKTAFSWRLFWSWWVQSGLTLRHLNSVPQTTWNTQHQNLISLVIVFWGRDLKPFQIQEVRKWESSLHSTEDSDEKGIRFRACLDKERVAIQQPITHTFFIVEWESLRTPWYKYFSKYVNLNPFYFMVLFFFFF